MTTKEKILDAALTLFSQKGYSDVYVADIARAVGIKAPSLYKHYKSKQEIFDSCVEVFSKRMEEVRSELRLPGTPQADVDYKTVDSEKIVEIATRLFTFYLTDDVAARFRRMLMIERYHNPKLDDLFDSLFISGAVEYEEQLFAELIKARVIKGDDPHVVALRFYTPIFYLLQKYDTRPDRIDEANRELASVVGEFCETYGAK
jgi:AcrR family transcriptional regulator